MLFDKTLGIEKEKQNLAQSLAEESRELAAMIRRQQELAKQLEEKVERLLNAESKISDALRHESLKTQVTQCGRQTATHHWLHPDFSGRGAESKETHTSCERLQESYDCLHELGSNAGLIHRILGVNKEIGQSARKAGKLQEMMEKAETRRKRLLRQYR